MFKRGKLGGLDGGQYRPLTDSDVRKVHQAVVRIMSEIGIKVANRKAFELFKSKGLKTDEEKQLVFITEAFLGDCIDAAPSELILHGRGNPDNDIIVGGKRVHFGSGGERLSTSWIWKPPKSGLPHWKTCRTFPSYWTIWTMRTFRSYPYIPTTCL